MLHLKKIQKSQVSSGFWKIHNKNFTEGCITFFGRNKKSDTGKSQLKSMF